MTAPLAPFQATAVERVAFHADRAAMVAVGGVTVLVTETPP